MFLRGPKVSRRGARGYFGHPSIRAAASNCARLTGLGLVFVAWFAGCKTISAQQTPSKPEPVPVPITPETSQPSSDLHGQIVLNSTGACVKPPTMVQVQDYSGPFHEFVGTFTHKLDRLSAHDPHYKPGAVLCSLEIKDKFSLFLRDSVDPETFLAAGFDAGISQAENHDPQFGQGAFGYGKRYGAIYLDEVQFRFFKEFSYPTIFSEDPRYYRIGEGSRARRFLRPFKHAIVAYNDKGKPIFNFSEWLGEASGTSLSNLYHPGNKRGFGPAATGVGIDVALDIGYDEIREFWPELARKLRLPFRDESQFLPENPLPPIR